MTSDIAALIFESDPVMARYFDDVSLQNPDTGTLGGLILSPELQLKYPEEPRI